MSEIWRVDLHNHTHWSTDCITQFDKLIQICEKRAIKRIAITDHNTADGALKLKQIAPELVIVGEEIFTTEGEPSVPDTLRPAQSSAATRWLRRA